MNLKSVYIICNILLVSGALAFLRNIQCLQFGALKGWNRSTNVYDELPTQNTEKPPSYAATLASTVEQFRSKNPPNLSFLNQREEQNFDFRSLEQAFVNENMSTKSFSEIVHWSLQTVNASNLFKIGFKDALVDFLVELLRDSDSFDRETINKEVKRQMTRCAHQTTIKLQK